MFGRTSELERLSRIAHAAEMGRRLGTALVDGEPGIGKTALLEVFSVGLATAGWRVLWGRCPEAGGAPPLWPWQQVINALTGEPLDKAATGRFQTSRAIVERFGKNSGTRPLAVLLDDLHAADEGTLAVLRDVLADVQQGTPIMIIGTFRPAEVSQALSDTLAVFARKGSLRLPLGPLPDEDAAALVRAVQAEEGTADRATPEVIAAIVERAGGNPFYLRELARLPPDDDAPLPPPSFAPSPERRTPPPTSTPTMPPPPPRPAPQPAAAAPEPEPEDEEAAEVPAGIAEVIRLRVARLPALTRNVLRVVSVIGREADVRLVVAAQRHDPDDVYDALEAAIVSGLLEEPAAGRVRFAHVLVRDTIYGDLLRLRRARLHADVGKAAERLFPGDLTALAHHFSEAAVLGNSDQAVRYCRAAAEAAEEAFTYGSALALWERALAAFDRDGGGDPVTRTELLIGQARATQLAGKPRLAYDLRTEAVRAAREIGDPRLTARAIVAIDTPTLWYSRPRGRVDLELIDLIERTLPEVPDDVKAQLRTSYALEAGLHHDPEGAAKAATEAVEWARQAGDDALLAGALNAVYFADRRPGHYGDVTRAALELERVGREARMPGVQALGLLAQCVELGAHGEVDAIAKLADAVRELADRYELPVFRMQVELSDAARELVQGDLRTAERIFAALAEAAAGREMWDLSGAGVIGRICARQAAGDLGSAEPDARLIASFDTGVGTPLHASTLAARGDREAALDLLLGAPEPALDQLWLLLEGFRADALLLIFAGDSDRASAGGPASPRELAGPLYERLVPYEPFVCGGETMGLHTGPVAARLARLAELLGIPGAPARHWDVALTVARRARAPRWEREARAGLESADLDS
nr:AAA family ATPase [Actinomadura barringtoniae]